LPYQRTLSSRLFREPAAGLADVFVFFGEAKAEEAFAFASVEEG
jgi:hypothetical protein